MQVINIGILIVLFGTSTCFAIQCYQCSYTTSAPDQTCFGPNVSSSHLVTCPTGQNFCSTSVSGTFVLGVSSTAVTRSCTSIAATPCFNFGSLVSSCTYTCTTDGCNTRNGNTGNMVTASLSIFLITICISLFFLKL